MNWYLEVLKKYAVFSGRARRKEYWMFILFNFIIVLVLGFIEGMISNTSNSSQSILSTIYNLAVLVPTIAVGVRRMHDTDHSGWWLLFPIVNLVFALTEGTKGNNKYGANPKAISQAPAPRVAPTPSKAETCNFCKDKVYDRQGGLTVMSAGSSDFFETLRQASKRKFSCPGCSSIFCLECGNKKGNQLGTGSTHCPKCGTKVL